MHKSVRRAPFCIAAFALAFSFMHASNGFAQVVQLPNLKTFSISGGVAVPDQGQTELSSHQRNALGSGRTRTGQSFSQSASSGTTSVRSTIINLQELDLMIRNEACHKPQPIVLGPNHPKIVPHEHLSRACTEPAPAYAYMMTMSHDPKVLRPNNEDAHYYLELAKKSVRTKNWSNVELYYSLAWQHLPQSKRDSAVKELLAARETRAEKERLAAESRTRATTDR